jgi:hypothetical protein
MADTERNYGDEAKRIVTGELSMLPQREHLAAMAGQMESIANNLKLTLHLLTALMHDAKETEMHFPKGLLDAAEQRFTKLNIVKNPDASVTVTRELVQNTPQPRSVN